jgi:hypothetical protein
MLLHVLVAQSWVMDFLYNTWTYLLTEHYMPWNEKKKKLKYAGVIISCQIDRSFSLVSILKKFIMIFIIILTFTFS